MSNLRVHTIRSVYNQSNRKITSGIVAYKPANLKSLIPKQNHIDKNAKRTKWSKLTAYVEVKSSYFPFYQSIMSGIVYRQDTN